MKPIKAWAVVSERGELRRAFASRNLARKNKCSWERIVRVEIREVPRKAKGER